METIREQSKNPVVVGVVSFVLGILIGLVVLGWWLFPVKWVNATPNELSYEHKVEYLRTSIEAFGFNGDIAQAQMRFASLGDDAEGALNDIIAAPGNLPPELINSFHVTVTGQMPSEVPVVTTPETSVEEPSGGSIWGKLIPILCVIAILVIGAGAAFFFLKQRGGFGGNDVAERTTPLVEEEPSEVVDTTIQADVSTEYQTPPVQPPLGQFMATYRIGDDLFDDSFSIDSQSGEFLGECGVGISETIGVGDPKKVTAFEVWLFDKNDIQTITKVFMSAHAFEDNTIRQRLTAKGEPVLAEMGTETILETQTLQLIARVVDMQYGEGALPSESFFNQFSLELIVMQKA